MPFQFYCPQGHLLQGDESQMGQQSQCPMCGTLFMIPMPQGAPAMQQPAMQQPAAPPPPPSAPAPAPEPPPEPPAPVEPQIVRIPCPNGHVLETPSDMFGQQALCPYCNVQFELNYEDSEEYKQDKLAERRKREEAFNQKLVKYSFYAAGFVVVMLVGMIAWQIFSRE